MATNIEWTDETWNPVTGCSKVSQGCKNCYAERMAKRLQIFRTRKPSTLVVGCKRGHSFCITVF